MSEVAAGRIKGITVEIGGDTTGLSKALQSVNKQIRDTKSDLRDVERLLKLDPGNTELLAQKQRLLGNEIASTKDKLQTLRTAAEQANEALAKGDISQEQYDGLQREIAETEQQLKELEKTVKEFGNVLSQQFKVAGEKMKEVGDKVSDVGTKMLPATAAIAGIGTAAVKTTADFDTAMSKVRALSGAGEEDFQKLRDTALEMGEKTAFSASEAADALGYMALAGWDAEKSTKALPGVLNLAAASGMDLAKASDMVTDYLSAFGMEADKAAYLSDILAYAQANSNTSAEQLGDAYKNCAANLHAAGQDVETVTSLLEAMANQGTKGGEAGTALAAIMRDITQKMDRGAIKIGKTTVAVQDASGNFRDLTDILKDVEKATDGLGSAEKAAALSATFTSDSTKGLNQIFTEGVDTITGYEEALRGSLGTASEQADVMLDNLNGQLTLLKSAVEGAAISIGETLTPMISKLVKWIQNMVDWFNGLDDSQKNMIVTIGLVVAAIGPLLIIIGKVISLCGTVSTAMSFLAANPIVLLIAGIALLVAALVGLVGKVAQSGDEMQNRLQQFDDFLQGIFARDWTQVFGPVLGTALNAFLANVSNVWNAAKQILDGIINFIRGVFTGDWERAWTGLKQIVSGVFGGLGAIVKVPLNGVIAMLNGMLEGVNWVIRKINGISFKNPFTGKRYDFNLPTIGNVPYLAKGGVLLQGSAVVGEAGPELLTMTGSSAVVQPLTKATTNNSYMGGLTVNVYGAPGQSEEELAELVAEKIQDDVDKKGAVFA